MPFTAPTKPDTSFDPVAEARQRYPGLKDWSDDDITENLSDPNKFRQTFPDKGSMSDQEIQNAVSGGPLTRFVKGAGREALGMLKMPWDVGKKMLESGSPEMAIGDALVRPQVETYQKGKDMEAEGEPERAAFYKTAGVLPIIGPMAAAKFSRVDEKRDLAGAIGEGATDVGSAYLPKVPKILRDAGIEVPKPFKGIYANDRTAPNAPTRGEIYQTVRDSGGNMNMAQASESPGLRAKEVGLQSGLGSARRMATANAANAGKYGDIVDSFKNDLGPDGSVVEQGAKMQRTAKLAKEIAHDNATQGYDNLDSLFKTEPVSTQGVKATAAEIADSMRGPNELMPSTAPKKLMGLLDEIQNLPNQTWFGTMHRMRSRLMNAMFSDELAPREAEGAARQLAGSMETTMENAANKAGAGKAYTDAQAGWAKYLNDFNDPGSPMARAITTQEPGKVLDYFLSNSGKGSMRALTQMDEYAPEFKDLLRREFVRRLHDPAGNAESTEFGKMEPRMLNYSQPFMEALFTPEQLTRLRNLAAAGKSLNFDANPSGTARAGIADADLRTALAGAGGVGTGLVTAAQGHPVAGAAITGAGAATLAGPPILRNIGARIVNSPRLVDYVMGYEPKAAAEGPSSAGPSPASLLDDVAAGGSGGKGRREADSAVPKRPLTELVGGSKRVGFDTVGGGGENYSAADLAKTKERLGITGQEKLEVVGGKPQEPAINEQKPASRNRPKLSNEVLGSERESGGNLHAKIRGAPGGELEYSIRTPETLSDAGRSSEVYNQLKKYNKFAEVAYLGDANDIASYGDPEFKGKLANELGTGKMKQMVREFFTKHPDVDAIGGHRIGGRGAGNYVIVERSGKMRRFTVDDQTPPED